MVRITFAYSLLLAWVTLLANTGTLSGPLSQFHSTSHGDKLIHFFFVGFLALMTNLAIRSKGATSLFRATVPGSLFVFAAATCEECSNMLLETRGWSLGDLVANYLGIACLGVLPVLLYHAFGAGGQETRATSQGCPSTAVVS